MEFLKSKYQKKVETEAYDKVAKEIKNNDFKEGLKTKAYSKSGGNKTKAESIYIKYRVKEIIEEIKERDWQQKIK